MLFEPENFRGGEAGQDGIAEGADGFAQPAERFRDFIALSGS